MATRIRTWSLTVGPTAPVCSASSSPAAEVVAAARERQARYIEPTAEAEADWIATIRAKERYNKRFLGECTPSYYSNEGKPNERSESYGGGPIEFYELLRKWRAETDMADVIVN
ncbi:hypothetical protein MOQ72_05245 [Saccharopolyspora sp. K220]|uniref:hypothetical protein n=1 Tax=Saccharopolyspora soli TaxID=2926618 RepID=UPI001F581421|nr:hypothetical protein [Saccharopolyspora soli]MCI2416822.1 hypothetical protein [Saccharopolyspora soli]